MFTATHADFPGRYQGRLETVGACKSSNRIHRTAEAKRSKAATVINVAAMLQMTLTARL